MNQTNKMKLIRTEDRPYEKCERFGVSSLSEAELLAVIIRTGTRGQNCVDLAAQILYGLDVDLGILNIHQWNREQLLNLKGVGRVKALQILCLSELTKRLSKATGYKRLCFTEPKSIADYYMEDMRHLKQEQMKLLLFNTKTRLLGETDISKGTVNASLISPRELFIEALQKNAVSIILLHNHPSGDPMPSKQDILVTRRIKEAGDLIGIQLLDHIIIGNNCYMSFIEEGFMDN